MRVPRPPIRGARAPVVLAVLLAALAAPRSLHASVFVVDRGDDSATATACDDAVPADCSLRGAILAANASPGSDTVVIDFTSPFGRTMLLTLPRVGADSPQEGDLDVTDDLLIDGGLDQGALVLAADPFNDRMLDVAAGVHLELNDLILAGGRAPSNEVGGGIRTLGSDVRLIRTEVTGCTAAEGGGIHAGGVTTNSLLLSGSAVVDNSSTSRGGGILLESGGLRLLNSTVSGNLGGTFGGALMVGQMFPGNVSIEYSTISDNTSGQAQADIYLHDNYMATVEIVGSILDADCHAASSQVASLGGNLEAPGDTCGLDPAIDRIGVPDMRLAPLATSGDVVTHSHQPLWNSPALDNPQTSTTSCPYGDQRLHNRPRDGNGDGLALCDSGSVEAPPPLFADGFESGGTGAWSHSVP